ncbi:MAG: CcmD family protein [Bacteroidota bacterium]
MQKTALSLAFTFFAQLLLAQSSTTPPADFMRSMGKMYVVVGVIVLVFLGLVIYMLALDRRLTKLEDQNHN